MCKEIPEECFVDSALVRRYDCDIEKYIVCVRCPYSDQQIPAPTLAEIMAELGKMADNVLIVKLADGWGVSATTWKDNRPRANHAAADPNPTIAALRVWLSLNDEEA